MGAHVAAAEHFSWLYKLTWIMASPEPGVTAQEFADALPTFDQIVTFVNAGMPHSYFQLANDHLNLVALMAEACEKMGLYEQALDFAERATTNIDITQGGSFLPSVQWRGYRTKGRCLAAMGKAEEAAAAFESALAAIKGFEYFLLEALCLRDLKVLVLDQDGRGAEGSTRLKTTICMLLGDAPVAEQLVELQASLGGAIDLSAILA
jgi:tetratricopeptide (TPR) repeat protein